MKIKLLSSLKKTYIAVIACILFLSSGMAANAENKASTLLGYVVIPDIVKTLEQIDKIANVIDPDQFKPGMLKGQAGMLLGDPSFDNINRTKPSVIMIFHNPASNKDNMNNSGIMNDFAFAVFLPAKDKARYQKLFEAMNLQSSITGDVVIISNKKPSLDIAKSEMELYRKISSQKPQCDTRLLMKVDRVMSVYNKEIAQLIKEIQNASTKNGENPEKNKQEASLIALGKLFIYGFLDMAAQSKDYQLDITLSEKNILFSSEHSSKPGSALSRFFDGTSPGSNKCITLLPEKGQFTYAGYFDTQRFKNLLDSVIAGAIKHEPSLQKDLDMSLINAYKNYMDLYLGEFAIIYNLDNSSGLQMHLAAATDKSSDEHIAVNDRLRAVYNEAMKKMGQDVSGLSEYTIQKNFRKSNGVDVHRYVFKMDYSKMSENDKKSFEKLFGDVLNAEYAVANGYLVASTNPAVLDKIIANTTSGGKPAELLSIKAFDAGMDSYIDLDIISFIEKISESDVFKTQGEKNPQMDKTMKMLKNLTRENRTILASSKYSKGSSFNNYQVPMKMIIDIIKFANEQKKEQMMQNKPFEIPMEDSNK